MNTDLQMMSFPSSLLHLNIVSHHCPLLQGWSALRFKTPCTQLHLLLILQSPLPQPHLHTLFAAPRCLLFHYFKMKFIQSYFRILQPLIWIHRHSILWIPRAASQACLLILHPHACPSDYNSANVPSRLGFCTKKSSSQSWFSCGSAWAGTAFATEQDPSSLCCCHAHL